MPIKARQPPGIPLPGITTMKKLTKPQRKFLKNIEMAFKVGLTVEGDLVFVAGNSKKVIRTEHFVRCERCGKKMKITCSAREFEDTDGLLKCTKCMKESRKKELKRKPVYKNIWDHR